MGVKTKNVLLNCAVLAGVLLVTWALSILPIRARVDHAIQDLWFKLRGPIPVTKDLALVCISNECLERIGKWPWDRDIHALSIGSLQQHGAKVIALDILFAEPGNDAVLAAVTKAGSNVIHVAGFLKTRSSGVQRAPEDVERLRRLAVQADVSALGAWRARDVLLPTPDLLAVVTALGHGNAEPDLDGVTRRLPLFADYEGHRVPALGLKMAMMRLGVGDRDIEVRPGALQLSLPDGGLLAIPVDEAGCMVINYPGEIGRFSTYSYVDVLEAAQAGKAGNLDLSEFEGKVVLFGMVAEGSTDLRPTPFSTLTPMMCVHAAIANTILTRNFVRSIDARVLAGFYVALVVLLCFAFAVQRPWVGGVVSGLAFVVLCAVAFLLFARKGLLVNIVPMLTLVVLGSGVLLFKHVFVLDRKKRVVDGVIRRYVSENILKEVYEHPELLKIGGVRQELSVFFSDVRGFTALTDRSEAEFIVNTLNEYLGEMIRLVHKYGGTLDKIRGDGFMTFFGNPVPQKDHALRAVRMAIEMQQVIAALQARWQDEGLESMSVGMGICTGWVTVGNIGSESHFEYTVIGSNVNMAARIEAAAKGGQILINHRTYALVKNQIDAVKLEPMTLKGFAEPVVVYEVRGELSSASSLVLPA